MDPCLLPAVEQLQILRRGEISQQELAAAMMHRVAQLDPLLHAFAEFDADRVRAEAAQRKQGRLAGLPMTVKSSLEVTDYRCEIGSVLRRGVKATQDARAVKALREAGAIVLGTTVCPEFLMAYESDNLLHGQVCNPWDLNRSAGGSSGGEAAGIAACLSAGGLGSDSGGSVGQPAHATGICALKPTPGRVSAVGHQPPCLGPFSTIGAVGPMARTIPDLELIFSVLVEAGVWQGGSPPLPYSPVPADVARHAYIGWFEDDGLVPVTAETREAVRSAASELAGWGFNVRPFRPEGLEEARRLWRTFFLGCGAMFYEPTIRGQERHLSPVFREFLRAAEDELPISGERLLQAWAAMDELRLRFADLMQECPVLLMPVCSVPAFRHGERQWALDGAPVDYWDAMRFMQWFNVLALPAAVVPIGFSANGLPIGVQVVGRAYEDELVLAVASVLDKAFGYRLPPVARL